ncbi:hypothetical protein P7C73_g3208, partial [Tremellales sp. Uapishka_1]
MISSAISALTLLLVLAEARPHAGIQAREKSVAPSLTYASDSPSATQANIKKNPNITSDFLTQVKGAYDNVARFELLYGQGSDYWKFDFNPAANPAGGVAQGRGGEGVLADRKTFPMLYSEGVSMSMGFLNPCGMNTPHTHPRATEFLNIVTPVQNPVRTGFVMENGITMEFSTNLTQYQAALFPMGSIHFEFNDNCEAAVFAAAFSSDDPGLSSTANNFFSLDADIVNSTLGFPKEINAMNIAQFAPTIPKSFAIAVADCLDRCGIQY